MMCMKQYPYLPENRQIFYAPITNDFMALAKEIALNEATDSQHPTGAVVVKAGEVIGKSANRSLLGRIKLLNKLHQKGWCIRRLLKVKTGTKYWMCPGCVKASGHAEQRSIRDAIQNGKNPEGADLYLWGHWWCCKPCWDKIIEAGIRNVYLLDTSEEDFKR